MNIKVLPYKGKPLTEIRPAYFLKAFGEDVLDMRIFSFGRCNYSCPYCKRDGYDKSVLDINGAVDITEENFMAVVDDAIAKGQVIRLSGGDPVCYPAFAEKVLKYAKSKGGITSIAHNGSGPEFVKKIAPYLDFASIDFKAASYKELGEIAGIDDEMAKTSFINTIETIRILQEFGVYTDVRTCVFDDTQYEQLSQIAKLIQQGNDSSNLFWTLRTYSPVDSFSKGAKTPDEMIDIVKKVSEEYPSLRIGVRAKWEPEGFTYFLGGKQKQKFESKSEKRLVTKRISNEDSKESTTKRIEFEESLLRDDVVEYYMSKTPEELEEQFGTEVARMVGFEQKNSHHCFDLWQHTLHTVKAIDGKGLTEEQVRKLKVAAFFHDIGKPDVAQINEYTGQQVFYGHPAKSGEIAKSILKKIGYTEMEIDQLEFFIRHHDDFISYKSTVEPFFKKHEFIREISEETVAEKIIENAFNFETNGYDIHQIRAICYYFAHQEEMPEFSSKNGPVQIDVDFSDLDDKLRTGDIEHRSISLEDYEMLLRLCEADVTAQNEVAIQNGKVVGKREEKIKNYRNIRNSIKGAYNIYLKNALIMKESGSDKVTNREETYERYTLSEIAESVETTEGAIENVAEETAIGATPEPNGKDENQNGTGDDEYGDN
ncbi:MAG: radical SAM protein [Clostridia bacterium]|nr:radical SAM protein [Clostridia bacterium]